MGADRFFVQGGLGVGLDKEATNNLQEKGELTDYGGKPCKIRRGKQGTARLTYQENVAKFAV